MKDLLEHRENIFLYIRGYYRSFMKDINPDLFPQFILRDKNIKEIGEVE